MRPTVFTDAEFANAQQPAERKVIYGNPDPSDETGPQPVEAIIQNAPGGEHLSGLQFTVKVVLEPGDLSQLLRHGFFYYVVVGRQLQPLFFEMPDAPNPEGEAAEAAHQARQEEFDRANQVQDVPTSESGN